MSLKYNAQVSKIKGIQFGIMSPNEIRDRSVTKLLLKKHTQEMNQ